MLFSKVVLSLFMLLQHLHLKLPISSVSVISFVEQPCFLKSLGARASFRVLALLNTVIGCFGILSFRCGSSFNICQYFCGLFLIFLWSLLYVVTNVFLKRLFSFSIFLLQGFDWIHASCVNLLALWNAPFIMEVGNLFSLNLSLRMFAWVVKSLFLVQCCLIPLYCPKGILVHHFL